MESSPFAGSAQEPASQARPGTHTCPVCNSPGECIFAEPENHAHICTRCGSDFTIVNGKGILV